MRRRPQPVEDDRPLTAPGVVAAARLKRAQRAHDQRDVLETEVGAQRPGPLGAIDQRRERLEEPQLIRGPEGRGAHHPGPVAQHLRQRAVLRENVRRPVHVAAERLPRILDLQRVPGRTGLAREIVVGAVSEREFDHREPKDGAGAPGNHAGHAIEGTLDGYGHLLLHFFGGLHNRVLVSALFAVGCFFGVVDILLYFGVPEVNMTMRRGRPATPRPTLASFLEPFRLPAR